MHVTFGVAHSSGSAAAPSIIITVALHSIRNRQIGIRLMQNSQLVD